MLQKIIHLDTPNLGELEKKYLLRCIDTTFVSTHGPFVAEFENRFAHILGCSKAVSVQSGTAALHLALYELGIGKGDEVILPVLTFAATANAVRYVGAKPVFVDVDPLTWNLDPQQIEAKITSNTKAIIAVHLYGNPCGLDEIVRIARKHALFLIEDSAESFTSKFDGAYTGTIGDVGIFSFNGNKLITTGGGGMIVGKDHKRLDHIRFLANQARDEEKGYFHPEIGFNYRMTNIEAALGLAQIERIDQFVAKKKQFRAIYSDAFAGTDGIALQQAHAASETTWWLNAVGIDPQQTGKTIYEIQTALFKEGIPSRRIFMPLVEFPPYFEADKSMYTNAYAIYSNGLCLPSSTLNHDSDIEFVIKTLIAATHGE